MVNLILVVMAIMLGAVAMTVTMRFIPVDTEIEMRTVEAVERHVEVIGLGVDRYLDAIRDPATGAINLGPDRSDLMDDLSPEYVFAPRAPGNGQWQAGVGDYKGRAAVWTCLEPPAGGWSPAVRNGIERAESSKLPPDAGILANACGADTAAANGAYLTYWFPAHHHRHPGTTVEFVSAPARNTATLYDANRVVRIRLDVEGTMKVDVNTLSNPRLEARIEVRAPGGTWTTADTWSMTAEQDLPKMPVTGTTTLGGSVMGETNPPTGYFEWTRNGALEAVVPAGWELRLTAVEPTDATVTFGSGQLQRFF